MFRASPLTLPIFPGRPIPLLRLARKSRNGARSMLIPLPIATLHGPDGLAYKDIDENYRPAVWVITSDATAALHLPTSTRLRLPFSDAGQSLRYP